MTTTAERITEAGVNNSNVKSIPRGTVLMSFKLTLGRVAIAGMDLYSNEAIAAFYPDTSHVFAGWLFHVLPRVAASASAEQAVKGQTLNKDKLQRLKLLLPPLPEQRRIAEILDTADDAIRQSEQLIAKLKAVKAGLLHDLLTRGLDEQGRLRDPDAHPEQFKDSPLGRIPVRWTVEPLGHLCTLLNGLAFRPENWTEFGMPIIRIQNLNGSLDFNRFDGAVPEPYLIAPHTILFSWSGNRGTSFGPYLWAGPTGILNQHIFKVTPHAEVRPLWLFYALDDVRVRAERAAHGGSGLVHVRRGDLLAYLLATPSQQEQKRIEEIVGAHDARIRAEEAALDKLRQVKRGLMDDLLTGRVRVPRR